jgi:hypothetical protein
LKKHTYIEAGVDVDNQTLDGPLRCWLNVEDISRESGWEVSEGGDRGFLNKDEIHPVVEGRGDCLGIADMTTVGVALDDAKLTIVHHESSHTS